MGMSGTEEVKSVFTSCVKAITEIFGLLDDFWGPHANLVDSLLDDLATELRQRVELKLALAYTEFNRRFGSETQTSVGSGSAGCLTWPFTYVVACKM
jgi:hypothetical protein